MNCLGDQYLKFVDLYVLNPNFLYFFLSTVRIMAPVNRCDECQRTMPTFDKHRNCARCRPCATRDHPHCATCQDWGDRLWGLHGKWLALHEPALARALGLTPGASPGKTLVSGSNKTKSVCKPAAQAGVQLSHTEGEVVETQAGSDENSSAESVEALSLGDDVASLSSDGEPPRLSKFRSETTVTPAPSTSLGLADGAPLGPGPSTSQCDTRVSGERQGSGLPSPLASRSRSSSKGPASRAFQRHGAGSRGRGVAVDYTGDVSSAASPGPSRPGASGLAVPDFYQTPSQRAAPGKSRKKKRSRGHSKHHVHSGPLATPQVGAPSAVQQDTPDVLSLLQSLLAQQGLHLSRAPGSSQPDPAPAPRPTPDQSLAPALAVLQAAGEGSSASDSDVPTPSVSLADSRPDSDDPWEGGDMLVSPLGKLADEAEAVILRYLKSEYAVPDSGQPAQGSSMLFANVEEPNHIQLHPDLKTGYRRAAAMPVSYTGPKALQRHFAFCPEDMSQYFQTPKISEELIGIGSRFGNPNPFKSQAFRSADKDWQHASKLNNIVLRLVAYQASLADLSARDMLSPGGTGLVSSQDRTLIVQLQLKIAECLWSQASRLSLFLLDTRRAAALRALQFTEADAVRARADIPPYGPDLFNGQVGKILEKEVTLKQQSLDLAKGLKPSKSPKGRGRGGFQPYRTPSASRSSDLTVTVPGSSARKVNQSGGRGRAHSSKQKKGGKGGPAKPGKTF